MTAVFVQSLSSGLPKIVDIAFEIAFKAALLFLTVWLAHFLAGRNRLLLRSAL
jgi:hypothetical protein